MNPGSENLGTDLRRFFCVFERIALIFITTWDFRGLITMVQHQGLICQCFRGGEVYNSRKCDGSFEAGCRVKTSVTSYRLELQNLVWFGVQHAHPGGLIS